MAINWYPGHMHKANKDMTEALPQVDLVIELLDCRLPYSSQNPAIAELGKRQTLHQNPEQIRPGRPGDYGAVAVAILSAPPP